MGDILKAMIISLVIAGSIFLLLFVIIDYFTKIPEVIKTDYPLPGEKEISLSEINKNPEKYLNKKILVIGKFSFDSEFYINCNNTGAKIIDQKGNILKMCGNYNGLEEGKRHSLRGIIVKDIANSTKEEEYIFRRD